ncbi:MAG: hypothetical protein L0H23_11870, partial [Luteimonas sp.]|nr:hypothetical protein [Luteimonas sp.]
LLAGCLAGCGDRSPATPASAAIAPATPTPPASVEDDGNVATRYTCQADTEVVLLEHGAARVSLPGGERHSLERVAGSDPQVYAGDSLYFTLGADSAHLSQEDGARELACTRDPDAG